MADLPPIPDEAVDAMIALMVSEVIVTPEAAEMAREGFAAGIAAAWPHLYAAALRHAASVGAGWGGSGSISRGLLHEMAGDVSRETNPDPQPQVETPEPGSKGRIGWDGPT